MNIRDELAAKFKEAGIVHFHVSWNHEWIAKLQALPEGIEKEAEKDKAFANILESFKAIERGEFTALTSNEIKEKIDGVILDPA